MRSISDEEFEELLAGFEREALHMEQRDSYGTYVELPHIDKWRRGEPDDSDWLDGWCGTLREHVAAGRSVRRARVVSEPLSEYQRWAHGVSRPLVEAGEDIRWVPRRLVSSLSFPGNDYYLIDDRVAIFLHYSGDGFDVDFTGSTDPEILKMCRESFVSAWAISIPFRDYNPE